MSSMMECFNDGTTGCKMNRKHKAGDSKLSETETETETVTETDTDIEAETKTESRVI
jgi:hypothetical protein